MQPHNVLVMLYNPRDQYSASIEAVMPRCRAFRQNTERWFRIFGLDTGAMIVRGPRAFTESKSSNRLPRDWRSNICTRDLAESLNSSGNSLF